MGYLHTDTMHSDGTPCDGRGEIWVRGAGVIQGYYKNPGETEAAGLGSEGGGWLRTGDIGKYE
jgi:long-chain acyl-CoA synthetase